jgi:hypothetical protein
MMFMIMIVFSWMKRQKIIKKEKQSVRNIKLIFIYGRILKYLMRAKNKQRKKFNQKHIQRFQELQLFKNVFDCTCWSMPFLLCQDIDEDQNDQDSLKSTRELFQSPKFFHQNQYWSFKQSFLMLHEAVIQEYQQHLESCLHIY